MKKRLLSILLVCVMLVSLLPTAAFATGETAYTAQIGETNYRFLQDAVNAVKDNETITLLRDCSENPLISRNVTFTLDQGDFSFSGAITKGSDNTDIAEAENVYTVRLVDKGGWTVTSTVDSEIKAYIQKEWEKAQTGVFIAGHPISATGWYESDGFPAKEETGTVYVDLTNHTVTLKNAQITVSSQPVTTRLEDCPRTNCTKNNVKLNNEIPYEGVLCLTSVIPYSAGSGACRASNVHGHYYMPRGYKSNYNGTDYFATIGLALLTEDDWSVTVEGTNSINVNAAFDHPDSTGNTNNGVKSGDAFGIYAKGALTLSGTGSLTAEIVNNGRDSGRNSQSVEYDNAAGLYASSLNITSGTYDITTKNTTGKVYTGADANGTPSGETEQTPSNYYGSIFADGNISISGSNTTMTANDALMGGAAIKAGSMSWPMGSGKITISSGANVTAKEQVLSDSMTAAAVVATNGIEIADTSTVVSVEGAYTGLFNYQSAITINGANVTVTVPVETGNESLTAYARTATVNSGKYKKAISDSYIAEGYYQVYEDDQYYHITNVLPTTWDAACGPNVYSGEGAGNAAIAAAMKIDGYGDKDGYYAVYLRQNSNADITGAEAGDVITVYLAEGVSYTGKVTGTGVKAEETTGDVVTYQGVSFTPHIFTVVVDPETAAAKIVASNGTETYCATMRGLMDSSLNFIASENDTVVLLKDASFDYETNYISFPGGKSYNIDFNGHKLTGYTLYNYSSGGTVKLSDSSASGAGGFAGTTNINVQKNAIISGGTYDASKIKVNNANATLAITGGFFTNAVNVANGTLTISGGYFATEPNSTYIADGYACVANTDAKTNSTYPYVVQRVATVSGFAMAKNSYVYGDALSVNDDAKNVMVGTTDVTSEVDGWTVAYFKNTDTTEQPVWTDAGVAPYPVGSYKAVVSIADDVYGGAQEILFSIAAKPLTITADNKSALVGADQPALTYTVSGLVGSDELTVAPTLNCTPNMSVAGSYDITVTGGSANSNYTITTRTSGKLTVLKASQSAPAKGEGYTIDGTTLTAADGYEILISGTNAPTQNNPTTAAVTITAGQTYFVRKAENTGLFASPYTAIDTTVSVAAIASPASMGTVSITGVTNGKCQIGASVTATATAKSGYEFVEWRNAAGTKIEGAEASYQFTADISTTLTAVFQLKEPVKTVATLPTVTNHVYNTNFHMGITNYVGCDIDGTIGDTRVGIYTVTAKLKEGYIWPDGTTADKTFTWSITPQPQAAPTGLAVNNMMINPVTDAMEYKLSTDDTYTPVPTGATSVTVDKPGTYYIRMKATTTALASKVTVVVVKEPTISAVTIQPANLETTSALFTGAAEPYSESRVTKVGFEYKTKTGDWTSVEATEGASFSKKVDPLTQDTDYIVRAFVTYTTEGESTTAYGKEIAFHTRKVVEPTVTLGEITAGATVEGTVAKKVIISVEEGNDVIASAISAEAISAGSTFKTTFENLPDGNYNVVVRTENGEFTETRMVTIENGATVDTMFTIPVGKLATVVDVKTVETPKVAVEGLAEMLTDTDKNAAAVGTQNVEIKLEAQKEENTAIESANPDTTQYAIAQIEKLIPEATATVEEKIETVLDLSLIKTTTELENDEVKSVEVKDIGSENNTVIEVAVPYATEGKTLKVYRYHDGVAEELTLLSSRPSANFIDGTYFVGDGYVFIYASGFSTYAISYEETKTVSGGGGGVTTYTITGADTVNGKLTVDKKAASSGSTVTITVTPDKGFTLETLTVLDKNGKEVEVKNLGNNKYSFKMPSSKVSISATFMEDNTMLNFFVDVKATDYYYDAVLWAAENDITKGTDAVHFSPDMGTTRAQVVTFLWRAAGCPEPKGDASKFVDVPANEYYAKAVAWAIEQGITKGTSETTFSPDVVCTRGQIVTFLARFAGVADEAAGYTHGFTDVKATDYYNNAVAWAKDNKVTEGTSATTFSPNTDCTRAQVVTFLYRWMVK